MIYLLPSGPLRVNTFLVHDEETNKGFIVDPGGFDPAMISKIEELGIDVEYIILTHGHFDHIGGVNEYKEKIENIKVVAHKDELSMLENAVPEFGLTGNISFTPDITVDEGDKLAVGNFNLEFIHTPGHTPGGMCILMGDILFSGDTLFHASFGRVDLPGGNGKQLLDSIVNKLFKLPDETAVLPGHMDTTIIGFEKENNPICNYFK